MKNRNVIFVSLIMSFVLALTGCSGGGGKSDSDQNGEADPAKTQQEGTPKEVGYPESLTYWVTLNSNASATLQNAGEIKAYQKLEEMTGTKVQFQHPPAGSEQDSFNIMVSSGDLPDVIEHNWSAVSGGPDKLIGDGTLIRLNELIDQHAPNLKKVLDENPEYRKMITSDDGNIYVFPFLRGDDYLLTYNGLIIRQDWLDKLGLGMPETIEEWHTVLTAFKNDDPNGNGQADEIPLRLDPGQLSMNKAFLGAWGITDSFYQVDGVVKYGPIQPEFKEFLQTMSRWYAEGLIDPDYLSGDSNLWDAKITNNTLGAFTGYTGSGIGRYLQMMEGKGGGFDLAGAPNVALKKGRRRRWARRILRLRGTAPPSHPKTRTRRPPSNGLITSTGRKDHCCSTSASREKATRWLTGTRRIPSKSRKTIVFRLRRPWRSMRWPDTPVRSSRIAGIWSSIPRCRSKRRPSKPG